MTILRQLLMPTLILLGLLSAASTPVLAERPIVAAASDLQFALEDVASRFQADSGHTVRLNFGSSGNFRRQIAQGAPFELYLSADEAYVEALYRDGHLEDEGVLYAIGRVVIAAPASRPELVDGSLETLRGALESGRITRFAIANPDHAPYGVAARQALQAAGLWERIEPYLVYGENVSQAARYALSDDTDGGIIAYSLVRAQALSERSAYELIPEDRHEPLRQRMALVNGAGATARAFYEYLQQDPARAILAAYGFVLPEDD